MKIFIRKLFLIFVFAFPSLQVNAIEMVPKYLYHFGSREILFKNIKFQNISQKDWDKYIMPSSTTEYGKFHYDYRKGLYGSRKIVAASFFAVRMMAYKKEPWVMRIALKDYCRTKESLFSGFGTLDTVLTGSQKEKSDMDSLINWMDRHRRSELGNYTARQIYDRWNIAAESDDRTEFDKIGKMLYPIFQDFLRSHPNYLTIVDNSWHDSFYIRDRNCIEKIDGTIQDVFTWLTSEDGWKLYEKTTKTYKGGSNDPNYHMIKYALDSGVVTREWNPWLRSFVSKLKSFERICLRNLGEDYECKVIRQSIDFIKGKLK